MEEIGSGMGFFPEIYSVKTPQKNYYLAISHGIFSTANAGQSLDAFTIEQNELRPVELIKYDEQKKIISIPVIAKNGAVTELFTRYRYNGKYFEVFK